MNNRIRDFAGQTAGTSYSDATTVVYRPETTNPGNVIVNMTAAAASVWSRIQHTGSTTVQAGT